MVTCISHNPAETQALGADWGRSAVPGLVIGLSGDLGAGKTQLVKGLAQGLGITQRVSSPTFGLVNIYESGRLVLNHLDLYRLDTRKQISAAGLEDFLTPSGLTVVEWIERWVQMPHSGESADATALPPKFRMVWMEVLGESSRQISYEDFGF
jgi:tRNA threonylcarbamoyladenosine biosynthesis protein TsaE